MSTAKRRRTAKDDEPKVRPAAPGDLEVETLVLYGEEGRRGRIHDAFEPVDMYWIQDEETGEIVRDAAGKIQDFPSSEIWIPVAEEEAREIAQNSHASAGVLLLGTEDQMMVILQHMGPPNPKERQTPQSLLAVPCSVADPEGLKTLCTGGVEEELVGLAQRLRDDIGVSLRVMHMKQVLRSLGGHLLKLQEYFYLVSVHLPFGWNDIKSAQTKAQERERKDVWNQIDVCVTARGEVEGSFDSPVEAARGAMGQYCGIEVSDVLWESKVQARLRAHAGAAELPLKTEDALGAEIFTVVLPEDAVVTKIKGVLCFSEAPGAWYLSTSKKPEELKKVHDKTVREWEAAQNEFSDEPSLPAGWLRIKSRTTGDVYFFNKSTQQSQFEMPEVPVPKKVEKEAPPSKPAPNRGPAGVESKKIDSLPAGWTQHISKRNGKVYYFHKATNISQYYRPKA
mmetsp:Transcript_56608/g.132888  ORF Transcript_56608/g.132888 Transcript_56608/m.132888 type:complete len:452 (+) Transcript_56608:71-1426(+)